MKATGVIRRIDDLGRIVLPIELRRTLGWAEKDAVAVFVDGESVVLRKYEPGCTICGEAGGELAMLAPNKLICPACITTIAKLTQQGG